MKTVDPFYDTNVVQYLLSSDPAVEPLTVETHGRARQIAGHYGFRFYCALMVAAALVGGCNVLYSEDLQPGQKIDV